MTDGFNFTLSSPLTKEDWNKICDAELEHTKKIVYKTPSGKEVTFISLAELEKVKAEIKEVQSFSFRTRGECEGLKIAHEIIDEHISELKGENK